MDISNETADPLPGPFLTFAGYTFYAQGDDTILGDGSSSRNRCCQQCGADAPESITNLCSGCLQSASHSDLASSLVDQSPATPHYFTSWTPVDHLNDVAGLRSGYRPPPPGLRDQHSSTPADPFEPSIRVIPKVEAYNNTEVSPSLAPISVGDAREQATQKSRPHHCEEPGCDKHFRYPKDLRRHLLTHSHEKSYGCTQPECSKSFSRKDHWIRHMDSKVHDRRQLLAQSPLPSLPSHAVPTPQNIPLHVLPSVERLTTCAVSEHAAASGHGEASQGTVDSSSGRAPRTTSSHLQAGDDAYRSAANSSSASRSRKHELDESCDNEGRVKTKIQTPDSQWGRGWRCFDWLLAEDPRGTPEFAFMNLLIRHLEKHRFYACSVCVKIFDSVQAAKPGGHPPCAQTWTRRDQGAKYIQLEANCRAKFNHRPAGRERRRTATPSTPRTSGIPTSAYSVEPSPFGTPPQSSLHGASPVAQTRHQYLAPSPQQDLYPNAALVNVSSSYGARSIPPVPHFDYTQQLESSPMLIHSSHGNAAQASFSSVEGGSMSRSSGLEASLLTLMAENGISSASNSNGSDAALVSMRNHGKEDPMHAISKHGGLSHSTQAHADPLVTDEVAETHDSIFGSFDNSFDGAGLEWDDFINDDAFQPMDATLDDQAQESQSLPQLPHQGPAFVKRPEDSVLPRPRSQATDIADMLANLVLVHNSSVSQGERRDARNHVPILWSLLVLENSSDVLRTSDLHTRWTRFKAGQEDRTTAVPIDDPEALVDDLLNALVRNAVARSNAVSREMPEKEDEYCKVLISVLLKAFAMTLP